MNLVFANLDTRSSVSSEGTPSIVKNYFAYIIIKIKNNHE